MAFSESLRQTVRKKSFHRCCICFNIGVEIHHIIPREEHGPDTEDNAAPLCPSCHDIYGSNPSKRKFIRETRDNWYEACSTKFSPISEQLKEILKDYVTREEHETLKKELAILTQIKTTKPSLIQRVFASLPLVESKRLIKNKEYEFARELLEKYLTQSKLDYEAHYLLGYTYGELNQCDKMIVSFNSSLQLNDKYKHSIDDFLKYFWAQNYDKGVKCFKEAENIENLEQSKLMFEKSLEFFYASLKCSPHSKRSLECVALVFINIGKFEEAIPYLKRSTDINKSPVSFSLLGQIYIELASLEEELAKSSLLYESAINILERGMASFPKDNEIILRLSNAYIGANKLTEAFYVFKVGVELEPKNKYYNYNYGVLLLNAQNFAEAKRHFSKALEIDGNYSNAIYNLAVTYLRWGTFLEESSKSYEKYDKYKMAIKYFEQYRLLHSEEKQIDDLLTKLHAKLSNTNAQSFQAKH